MPPHAGRQSPYASSFARALAWPIAMFSVLAAPGTAHGAVLGKSIFPTGITPGASTTLTFQVTNPGGAPARSDVGFVDSLPSGLRVAAAPSVGGTCANAAAATTASPDGTSITVAGLQVNAGFSTCTVTVAVTNAANQLNASCASSPTAFTNGPGNVSGLGSDTNAVQPSCLTVTLPAVSKTLSPKTIAAGGTSTLTFAVDNAAGNAVSNVGIVDNLPAGLQVASAANVGGTCINAAAATTATPGSTTITTTFLQIPSGPATCTVTVDVTNVPGQFNARCGALPAGFTNGSGNVTLTNADDAIAPACLIVTGGPVQIDSVAIPTLRDFALVLLALAIGALGVLGLRRRR